MWLKKAMTDPIGRSTQAGASFEKFDLHRAFDTIVKVAGAIG